MKYTALSHKSRSILFRGFTFVLFTCSSWSFAQHTSNFTKVNARIILNADSDLVEVSQINEWTNSSSEALSELYFYDWNNAYSSKTSKLAEEFISDFKKAFHLSSDERKGFTQINFIAVGKDTLLPEYTEADIFKLKLVEPIKSGERLKIVLNYRLKLPDSKFTNYGYDSNYINLNNFLLLNCELNAEDDNFATYANHNLNDQYNPVSTYDIEFINRTDLNLYSNLNFRDGRFRETTASNPSFYLSKRPFSSREFEKLHLNENFLSSQSTKQDLSMAKVTKYLSSIFKNEEAFHFTIDKNEFKKSSVFGLSELPSFINLYDNEHVFEMNLLNSLSDRILRKYYHIDLRKQKWIHNALLQFILKDYLKTYYKDELLLGRFAAKWPIRSYEFSSLNTRDLFEIMYKIGAYNNLDQPLSTSSEKQIKYNYEVANPYHAGLALDHLSAYFNSSTVKQSIVAFLEHTTLRNQIDTDKFQTHLENSLQSNLNWMFEQHINQVNRTDYALKKVEYDSTDSLKITVQNKGNQSPPLALNYFQNDSLVKSEWLSGFTSEQVIETKNENYTAVAVNYPLTGIDYNPYNDYKKLNQSTLFNKNIRLKFLKDIQSAKQNLLLYTPIFSYNLYDGIVAGLLLNNDGLYDQTFQFQVAPSYSSKEKTLIGSSSFILNLRKHDKTQYLTRFTLSAGTYHFETNSRYSTITPSAAWLWRAKDRTRNLRKILLVRMRNVFRTIDPSVTVENITPDYSILNARYTNIENNLILYKKNYVDAQLAKNFTKLSAEFERRFLFNNNTQLNLRLFAGYFVNNNTNNDFFSFALDKPSDYLFDLDYIGRSEEDGFFSQQFIMAEGGFKSKFENRFFNKGLASLNSSINLYRYVEAYFDFGIGKNRGQSIQTFYDTGIRLNLVTDYLELYFPVYNSNGWQISDYAYPEKIRFVLSLSPKTIGSLFTRKWL